MKLLGFLNLRGVSGQIAALVVASIITFPDSRRDLSYLSARSVDRPRTQSAHGASPASRCGAGGWTLTASRRHGAGVPATDGCKRWRDGVFRSAPAFTSIAVVLLALIAPDTSGYA
jgi:hypothetical protein